jgi:hypothetical protein
VHGQATVETGAVRTPQRGVLEATCGRTPPLYEQKRADESLKLTEISKYRTLIDSNSHPQPSSRNSQRPLCTTPSFANSFFTSADTAFLNTPIQGVPSVLVGFIDDNYPIRGTELEPPWVRQMLLPLDQTCIASTQQAWVPIASSRASHV